MSTSTVINRAQILKEKFRLCLGLPLRELLPESRIDPVVTVWTFLLQVLDVDKSCHNAVSRVVAWLSSEKVEIPSTDTSAYCQARKRLPEKLLQKLFEETGENLEAKVRLRFSPR